MKHISIEEMEGRAACIAVLNHWNQKRRKGKQQDIPYITHPAWIVDQLKDIRGAEGVKLRTIAWLHDVVEDTDMTLDDLRVEGFPDDVVEAVRLLTHMSKAEPYLDHLLQIKSNPLARKVKLLDLRHNRKGLEPSNLSQKYELCVFILSSGCTE